MATIAKATTDTRDTTSTDTRDVLLVDSEQLHALPLPTGTDASTAPLIFDGTTARVIKARATVSTDFTLTPDGTRVICYVSGSNSKLTFDAESFRVDTTLFLTYGLRGLADVLAENVLAKSQEKGRTYVSELFDAWARGIATRDYAIALDKRPAFGARKFIDAMSVAAQLALAGSTDAETTLGMSEVQADQWQAITAAYSYHQLATLLHKMYTSPKWVWLAPIMRDAGYTVPELVESDLV